MDQSMATTMAEETSSETSVQKKSKDVHLIVFEKGVKSFYYDRCEVQITNHTIVVTPDDKDANQLKRTIDDNFIRHYNIIVFFSTINGFALLFDHKKDCRWAYNVLERKRIGHYKSRLSDTALERRFIIPMIKELEDFVKLQYEFRVFILKLLKHLDVDVKERLAGMIIETGLDQCLLDKVLKGVNLSAKEASPSKKPKLVGQDESREMEDKPVEKRRSAIAQGSSKKPKLVNQDERRGDDNDGSNDIQQSDFNNSLPKQLRVSFTVPKTEENDEEGSPIKKPRLSSSSNNVNPSPITSKDPITLPFQIIDYTQCGVSKTHLFIFTDENRTSCYEFYWDSRAQKFRCCYQGCRKRGPVVTQNSDGIDQVHFEYPQCSCGSRPFDPEHYRDDILVFKPLFDIVDEFSSRLKTMKPKLFVYTSEEKKKAHKYDFDEKGKRYVCIKCRNNRHLVRAITCINEDNEEFVSIQNKPHKCEPIDC